MGPHMGGDGQRQQALLLRIICVGQYPTRESLALFVLHYLVFWADEVLFVLGCIVLGLLDSLSVAILWGIGGSIL